ncbi:hypothetical protein HK098_005078 [Nowakowskiella sp. JEL0407]|nr:hypothetical protein HK098_005078 [Nowakowskiella sp. JEL0407]
MGLKRVYEISNEPVSRQSKVALIDLCDVLFDLIERDGKFKDPSIIKPRLRQILIAIIKSDTSDARMQLYVQLVSITVRAHWLTDLFAEIINIVSENNKSVSFFSMNEISVQNAKAVKHALPAQSLSLLSTLTNYISPSAEPLKRTKHGSTIPFHAQPPKSFIMDLLILTISNISTKTPTQLLQFSESTKNVAKAVSENYLTKLDSEKEVKKSKKRKSEDFADENEDMEYVQQKSFEILVMCWTMFETLGNDFDGEKILSYIEVAKSIHAEAIVTELALLYLNHILKRNHAKLSDPSRKVMKKILKLLSRKVEDVLQNVDGKACLVTEMMWKFVLRRIFIVCQFAKEEDLKKLLNLVITVAVKEEFEGSKNLKEVAIGLLSSVEFFEIEEVKVLFYSCLFEWFSNNSQSKLVLSVLETLSKTPTSAQIDSVIKLLSKDADTKDLAANKSPTQEMNLATIIRKCIPVQEFFSRHEIESIVTIYLAVDIDLVGRKEYTDCLKVRMLLGSLFKKEKLMMTLSKEILTHFLNITPFLHIENGMEIVKYTDVILSILMREIIQKHANQDLFDSLLDQVSTILQLWREHVPNNDGDAKQLKSKKPKHTLTNFNYRSLIVLKTFLRIVFELKLQKDERFRENVEIGGEVLRAELSKRVDGAVDELELRMIVHVMEYLILDSENQADLIPNILSLFSKLVLGANDETCGELLSIVFSNKTIADSTLPSDVGHWCIVFWKMLTSTKDRTKLLSSFSKFVKNVSEACYVELIEWANTELKKLRIEVEREERTHLIISFLEILDAFAVVGNNYGGRKHFHRKIGELLRGLERILGNSKSPAVFVAGLNLVTKICSDKYTTLRSPDIFTIFDCITKTTSSNLRNTRLETNMETIDLLLQMYAAICQLQISLLQNRREIILDCIPQFMGTICTLFHVFMNIENTDGAVVSGNAMRQKHLTQTGKEMFPMIVDFLKRFATSNQAERARIVRDFQEHCASSLTRVLSTISVKKFNNAPTHGSGHDAASATTSSATTLNTEFIKPFSKYAPTLISEYLQILMSGTLTNDTNVKEKVVEGVYELLDLCGTKDLEYMLAMVEWDAGNRKGYGAGGVGVGARAVLKSLTADWTKFHKFKGKV